MTITRHALKTSVIFAIFGAALALLGVLGDGANGAQGGYVVHPLVRSAGLVALGTLVGGGCGWLVGAGPAKATIPVGLGSLLAIAGFVAGAAVGVNALGQPLIDGNASVLITSALVGAGIGWLVGSGIGFALVADLPPPTTTQARALRSVAGAALLIGVATARFEASLVGPGGLDLRHLSGVRAVTVFDGALLALVLALAGGSRRWRATAPSAGRAEASVARTIGTVGLAFGCVAVAAVVVLAFQSRAAIQTSFQARVNSFTVDSLTGAARDYYEKFGEFPTGLKTLLAFDGRVASGSYVNFAGPVAGRFCVRVGTDVDGLYGVPPYYSGLAFPEPRHSHVVQRSWVGDSCSEL